MMPGAGATFPGPLGDLGPPFGFLVLPLGFWPVTLPLRLGRFAPLGDCLRCRTTLGTSGGGAGLSAADGFEGSPIGAGVVLVGAGVVLVGAGVVLVGAGVVLVGAGVVLVGAGVVLVGAGVVLVGAGVVLVLGGCSAL